MGNIIFNSRLPEKISGLPEKIEPLPFTEKEYNELKRKSAEENYMLTLEEKYYMREYYMTKYNRNVEPVETLKILKFHGIMV